MNERQEQIEKKPVLAAAVRMLIAFAVGLLLGTLGNALAWNQLENPWPYLGLLCPLLLGTSVALIVGKHSTLGASSLAWIGFYLVFIVIAYHLHPYNPPPSNQTQSDQVCSPCFSGDVLTGVLLVYFFPFGLFFIMLIAFAASSLLKFTRRARNTFE
ncbi:MAG TPA: hypothetical protein VFV38_05810 [Ktedonobacteraceae bacterium]|nr:hypothetical protein [Ktedonobacteraceae bacterium]